MENEQWREVGGAFEVTKTFVDSVTGHAETLTKQPEVLYEKARGPYIEEVLKEVAAIKEWAEWAERTLIDESLESGVVTRRRLSEITGVALSTLQRWSKEPLITEDGHYGPGAGM